MFSYEERSGGEMGGEILNVVGVNIAFLIVFAFHPENTTQKRHSSNRSARLYFPATNIAQRLVGKHFSGW
jgi:hypothetical protein